MADDQATLFDWVEQQEPETRPIPGFDGYLAGTDGSLWTLWEPEPSKGKKGLMYRVGTKKKRLRLGRVASGYLAVTTRAFQGKKRTLLVHRAVLLAFRGVPAPGMLARHLNGNCLDNRLENLCWGTPEENEADKEIHGTRRHGTSLYNCKLDDDKVREIRRRLADGESQRALAREFGIKQTTIRDVKERRTWAHVTDGDSQ